MSFMGSQRVRHDWVTEQQWRQTKRTDLRTTGGWGHIERIALKQVWYHVQNRYLVGICGIIPGAQPGALGQPRGLGRGRGRRETLEGGIYTHMADSHCMAETNMTL